MTSAQSHNRVGKLLVSLRPMCDCVRGCSSFHHQWIFHILLSHRDSEVDHTNHLEASKQNEGEGRAH